jgi:Holliday junction resolvase RusA-like endonuclease
MQGDLDNIVKPILDALSKHIYMDDAQVEKIVVQKFEPQSVYTFRSLTDVLSEALNEERPVVYIRISNLPQEEST